MKNQNRGRLDRRMQRFHEGQILRNFTPTPNFESITMHHIYVKTATCWLQLVKDPVSIYDQHHIPLKDQVYL